MSGLRSSAFSLSRSWSFAFIPANSLVMASRVRERVSINEACLLTVSTS